MSVLRRRPDATAAWLGTAAALSLLLVLGGAGGGSPLRVLDPVLPAGALALLLRGPRRRAPLRPRTPGRALLACAAIAWACGMAYETTLSADGTGLGGMHGDTRSSFLLAQGWYVPAAVALPLLVRRLRLARERALLVGATLALYESALTAGPLFLSPAAPLGLLVAAYIGAIYAAITCAGVLLVDPATLWDVRRQPASRRRALAYGAATGVALWAAFMASATVLDAVGALRPA